VSNKKATYNNQFSSSQIKPSNGGKYNEDNIRGGGVGHDLLGISKNF
jgi:hypothetical protein